MVSIAAIVVTVIGFIISVTGGLVGFLFFPKLVEDVITETVQLVEGSDAFERWETLPIAVKIKVYFFNVENPQDIQQGAQPIVREIGPYIYNQYRSKINITREDDILSYYENKLFEFDQEASAPLTESDELTILNLPLMSTVLVGESTASALLGQLNSAIPVIFSNPTSVFLTTTPRDFLFDGIYLMCNNTSFLNSIVCGIIEANAPETMPRLEDGRFRFSLLSNKNATHDGHYSIKSGVEDVNELGDIVAWENSSAIGIWTENSTCDRVIGTDASIYPPFRTTESELYIFNTDVCRSVGISYSEAIQYSDIDGYRFVASDNLFTSPSNYSENECFCLNRTAGIRGDDGCLLDGAMELWDCVGAPLVLTHPHFYIASEVYQNGVQGLTPNESLHEIFADLEPMTGILLRGSKRVQFNLFIKPVANIALTTNLTTTLMPIVWIDEGIELTDELVDEVNTKLFRILNILSIVKWSTMIGGAILFAIGLIWLLISLRKSRKVY